MKVACMVVHKFQIGLPVIYSNSYLRIALLDLLKDKMECLETGILLPF